MLQFNKKKTCYTNTTKNISLKITTTIILTIMRHEKSICMIE